MGTRLWVKLLRLAAILVGAGLLLYVGRYFTEPVVAAIVIGFLYYLSLPITNRLERRKVPRVAAILIAFLLFAAIVTVLALYIIPILAEQLVSLTGDIPNIFSQIEAWIANLRVVAQGRLSPETIDELFSRVGAEAANLAEATARAIPAWISVTLALLLALVAGIIAAFYLLHDRERIREYVMSYVPEESKQRVQNIGVGINQVLSGFLRGRVIVATIVGAMVWISMLIVGLPYAFVLAIIAAVLEFIPYLGPILAAVPAVLLALAISPTTTILVLIVFFVIQQVESLILTPRVVGAHVRLHPMTVIFAILIGKELLGILGVFLAAPVAGVAKIFIEQFLLPTPQGQESPPSQEQEEPEQEQEQQ